jgi:hypothetical protein
MALLSWNLAKVCRIGTHPFRFAEYVNALRGLAEQTGGLVQFQRRSV